MKKDNRGASLIELIFVMAILAVLACSVGLGINLISERPANQCASKLKSMMQNNRVTTMGIWNARLEIYADPAGGVFVKEVIRKAGGTETEEFTTLVDKGVTVQYKDNDGTYRLLGNNTAPLVISYNRSSGAFNDLSATDASLAGKYCTEITVSKGSTERTLKLSYLTGKISLN
ncbi:MAG TPA: prepilin-type N-terminal cleavage/methylation domain-containing protein [Lachnospiraceae bacterium]|nr:prepilin-type N-terminal cleavage/methylation domain-containing protein [Lachnospiraceae bacterium]